MFTVAIIEEILVRGFIFRIIEEKLGSYYSLTISALIFGALHFAWNFTQSGRYGAITSGNEKTNSLLEAKLQGSEIITGGAFGPEGSIQATIIRFVATIIVLVICKKQNKIIRPY
jgi:membrane protease YdiL (CAAX protease family)